MPMKNSLESTGDTWAPKLKTGSGNGVTSRDVSNVSISGSIAVISTWLIHDISGLDVSPEVAIAFGTLGGYVVGRLLMY